MKLHLGCGEKYLDGYVNVDFPPSEHEIMRVKADVYADIRTLDYPPESIEEIRSHHLFEHFSRAEAIYMLLKWHSWLKPAGKLIIETPDAERILRWWMISNFRERMQLARHLFGSQEAFWAYHKDYWGAQKFAVFLNAAGFEEMRVRQLPSFWKMAGGWFIRRMPFRSRVFPGLYNYVQLPNIIVSAVKSKKSIKDKIVANFLLSLSVKPDEGENLLRSWKRNEISKLD